MKSKWGIGFEAMGLGRPTPHADSAAVVATSAKPRRRKFLKWTAISVGAVALLLGILLIAFRIALSHAPEYRAQVQAWVSERTGLEIQFTRMDARIRFYGPELVFDSAVVRSRDGKRTLVKARQVSLGFDVWTAITTLRLVAGRITLEAPELQVVRTQEGRIELVGQSDLPERDPAVKFEPDALPTGRVSVVDAQLTFRDLKTARGPWIVPGVNFDFKRRGGSMQLEGEAELPAKLGKSLRFAAATEGRLAEARELQWQFNVAAKDLDLAGWAELNPKDFPMPKSGQGTFTASGLFTGVEVADLAAKVQLSNVVLTLPEWRLPIPEPAKLETYHDSEDEDVDGAPRQVAAANLPAAESAVIATKPTALAATTLRATEQYDRIAFDLHLSHARTDTQETWRIHVKDLDLSRPKVPWRPSTATVEVTRAFAGGFSIKAESERLVLENLWPLLAYAPESNGMAQVRALRGNGMITDLQAELSRGAPEVAPVYKVHARLNGVGVRAIAKAPGITNLSGLVEGTESGGRFELNMRAGTFDVPRYFRTPLPAEKIAGVINWHQEADGWRIDSDEVLVDSVDGHARASGEVFVPKNGESVVVDVKADGWDLVAHAAPRYMPANKLSPKSLAWLDQAFVAGSVPKAHFEMRGPTRSFPYRNNEGVFIISAHVTGLTLDYQSGFVPATNLVVDAEFRNAGMTAKLIQGDVHGLPIVEGVGRFEDFKQSVLELKATAHGELDNALTYVQQSPIGTAIGTQFMALHGKGTIKAQVDLRLPLKDIEKRKVTIDSQIANAIVGAKEIPQTITELNGTLKIRDYALFGVDLRGRFLDGPVTIKGGVEGRYTGRGAGLLIAAQGRAQGAALAAFARLPSSIPLQGAMQWQFAANAPRHPPGQPAQVIYRVDSDTKGLGVLLPAPLGKLPTDSRNLHLEVDATRDRELLLRGAFGGARSLVRLQKRDTEWQFDRGGVRVDAVAASLPAHEGLRIEGAIESFVLDDWLKLKGDQPGKGRLADYLRAANVRIDNFSFMGFSWPSVRTIMQATDSAWRVDVVSDDIAGQLTIPYELSDGTALQIALNKLNVRPPEAANAREKTHSADPRDVPAIAGRVDEFSLAGRHVGVARFALDKVAQGVRLRTGEIRGDSFTATAKGSWLGSATDSTSSLTLDVASTDVRNTLRAFNFRDAITGERANAHAQLSWSGGIDEDLLGRASGKVQIEVMDGQLVNVDPGGAGRVLGLLSIGALPRRLSLDFSDVTDKGISFDKVHADFELNNGDAFTDNLFLSGPQAEVGIVGRTGLGKRDYDLTAVGAGDIGGSLTVAGTVVGGPVVGAAVLAFTRLFKQPLKGVTRRYYRITGSWENPTIESIGKQEAKQDSAEAAAAVSETQKENEVNATTAPSEETPAPSPNQAPVTRPAGETK